MIELPDSVRVAGNLIVTGTVTGAERSSLESEASAVYPLPLSDWRVWDAYQTPLGTAGSDDLGIRTGTFGTAQPIVVTSDADGASITQRARILFTLPVEYTTGGNVAINFCAGMVTALAATTPTATIDVEVYRTSRTSTGGAYSGSDLVTTSAQSINSLTFASYQFTLTPTGLVPGDQLDIRVTIIVIDGANDAVEVIGAFTHSEMLLTVQG